MHGLWVYHGLQVTNCLLSGRGQYVTPRISQFTPLKYISGTAEAGVVKVCVLAGYVKC